MAETSDMAEFPDELKRRVVMELATFQTSGEVSRMLAEEYGFEAAPMEVIRYDATKAYCVASKTLQALFHETRREYVEGTAELYIANEAYRLRRLQRMSEAAERRGDLRLAAALLEQAAKDHGGSFTNVSRVEGRFAHAHMTPDQARATIAGFLKAKAALPAPKG
jgi:hypothetical protein